MVRPRGRRTFLQDFVASLPSAELPMYLASLDHSASDSFIAVLNDFDRLLRVTPSRPQLRASMSADSFLRQAIGQTAAKAEALLMSPRYLLDTNTASYIIKGNIPRVRERLLKVPMSGLLISAATEAELLYGAARKSDSGRLKTAVDEFLLRVDSLAWDSNAARRYADLRAALEIAGTPMGNLDMMIAAQALAAEAILVTNDRSFFRLKHLKIEDWTK